MIITRDVPIEMDDGIVLRADVFRPDTQSQVPVIMVQGPYGKGVQYQTGYAREWKTMMETYPNLLSDSKKEFMTWETCDPEIWTAWGYATVRVDSRGSGRSPGFMDMLSPREIQDYYLAIEWAGTQSWSNGKVGLNGISYYAMGQWLVAALQPPHLTAIIPWEGCSDFYRDAGRHGGIASNAFIGSWWPKQAISNQHGNVNGHMDPWLSERATGPAILSDEQLRANRKDPVDEIIMRPLCTQWYKDRTPDWSKVTVPFLSAGNWGGFGLHQRGNFEAFTRAASKQKWLEVHAGRHDSAFYLDHCMALQKRFFDHFLQGEDNGWVKEPPVILQMRRPGNPNGEYRKEGEWPLKDTKWSQLFLAASNSTLSSKGGEGHHSVSFEAMGDGLRFESEPLSETTEITGPMAAKLFLSSSTTEADLFITVQAFSPEGKEVEFQGAQDSHTPLAQGWLRASHRKLDPEKTTLYKPYHTHDEVQPLTPGEIYEVDVEIWATHITLPAGYRLVLLIAGQDFERPVSGTEFDVWRNRGSGPFLHNHPEDRGSEVYKGKTTIHTGKGYGSYLLLPVIKRQIP